MSFQEGERPTRPVRPRGPQQQDDQQILFRRLIAGGIGVLVLIVMFIAIKGCLGSRKDSAYRNYASDVKALVTSSNGESKALYTALSTPPEGSTGGDSLDVQNIVNTQAQDAQDLVNRAKDLDTPGELDAANNWLIQTLQFRADALDQIADALPQALGDKDRKPAIDKIAAQNQALLTSDVIYSQRTVPDLNGAFQDRDINEQFPKSNFLPVDQILTWLDPEGVQDQLDKLAGGAADDETATPGLHGTGVGAVTVGGTELVEGEVNRVPAANPAFEVQVENQGDNEETGVAVTVTVAGAKTITAKGTIARIAAGETGTATIPLGQAPPTDGTSAVTIDVAAVPGEGTEDNNTVEYEVAFTT